MENPVNISPKTSQSKSKSQSNLPENNSLPELENPVNISAKKTHSKSENQSNLPENNLLTEWENPVNISAKTTHSKSENPSNLPENNLLTELENPVNISAKTSQSKSKNQSNLSENNLLTEWENPVNISPKTTLSKVETKSNLSISEISNQSIYEKVLPIILENLKQLHNEKDLSKILKVRVGQLRFWLNQACAEEKIIKTKKPVNYRIYAETQEHQNYQISTQQLSIYEAVLPIILENLEKPQTDKDLATKLNVNIGQLQDWLKIAKTEGKIISQNQSNTYVISQDIKQLSLFDTVENNEEGLDW
ncbi:MAG: hypothetical protein F6K40_20790 [Okeania sp. SIO3I5]|uniref:hypothetical protein n=1 Tax=Okeania sp. SIO3I5 TaxID=2607805 RepID=UPI0013BCBECC|nr:hypothetical protein [Okeania sp. SIO3I5]NEQ38572.1 hypothetical protein [Okeania sp. SIO3I5]